MPPKELRAILLRFFNSEQINEASRMLLAEILRLKPEFNRKLPNRRNSKNNPDAKSRLEVDNFLSMLASTDEAWFFPSLPIFATADPDLIPSRQLLEGGYMAIMRQFAAMSEQFADIKTSLEQVCASTSYAVVFPQLEGGCLRKRGKGPGSPAGKARCSRGFGCCF